MADSFSKKENSKKKIQKQQEKLRRREERKSNNNKGKDLDEMLIYVDKMGNLTELTPAEQEAEAKREHPRGGAALPDSDKIFQGIVSYYSEKGYGFITENQTKDNLFVHSTDISQVLTQGDKVAYKKQKTAKGLRALEVKII